MDIRVTAKDPQGNINPGIYTGTSIITGKHYVSFYNGYTRTFDNLNEISFSCQLKNG